MRDLDRLLNPRSIAVIGGGPAARAIEESERLGFRGEIWPVHPTKRKVGGRTAFPSLAALPGVPDAAFVAVNRKRTIEAVHQLAALGAGGAVLYASGFAEAGPEGRVLQDELVADHDLPLIGPNCYGTINARTGAALWPDVNGCTRVERGPAFLSQSGNIALNMTMNRRAVDFAYVISLGNQASVTVEECIAHFAVDSNVTSIGIYLESINDSIAFAKAALLAREHGTPIVVLKTGQSTAAETIAMTHTAAMAAPSAAYDALFERYGIVSVDSLPELMTTLSLLESIGPLAGNRLVSLSCSGGEASVVADRSAHHDVVFEPLTDDHVGRIKATLSELVAMTNPLDYHTFIWGDEPALERCFTEVLDGPFDAAMLVLDWPAEPNDDAQWWPTLRAFEAASHASGTLAIVVAGLPENLPQRVREHIIENGLGFAYSIDEALAGLAACARLGRWFAAAPPSLHFESGSDTRAVKTLNEWPAKQLLVEAGINVPHGMLISDGSVPSGVGYPAVAKIVGADHKADRGGVILDIANEPALIEALGHLRGAERPSGTILVEEMITGTIVELLLSVCRRPPIGLVATIGAGGTLVELLSDTATVLLPVEPGEVAAAIARLGVGQILQGYRGGPGARLDPVVDVVHSLTELLRGRPDIAEIEINPLLVTPTAAIAVDALVTMVG